MGSPAFTVLLLAAVVYLIYRVHRLEKLVLERGGRKGGTRPSGDGKVIPILKDNIEPGPFKPEPERE